MKARNLTRKLKNMFPSMNWHKLAISSLVITSFFIATISVRSSAMEWREEEIYPICCEIGDMYGIQPELIQAICFAESTYNPNEVTGECKGLMQVNERLHKDRMNRLGVTNIYDEYGNILVGTDLLFELSQKYGEVSYALDRYNGNSKAKYYYENGILSPYATKVLNKAHELEVKHYGK